MVCHAEQSSFMFRAAWQMHSFQNTAGVYHNIIVSGAEAVTLEEGIVCPECWSGMLVEFTDTFII